MAHKDRSTVCQCGCGRPLRGESKSAINHYPARFIPGHSHRGKPSPKRYVPSADEAPSGLCECGCGQRTTIARMTNRRRRHFRGYPTPFIRGHRIQPLAEQHWNFTGRRVNRRGYVYAYAPDHPNACGGALAGYVLEHRLVMEQQLGRLLRDDEDVHHINGVKHDNRPENLIALTHAQHLREHRTGNKPSADTRRKLSEAMRRVWAERRARHQSS